MSALEDAIPGQKDLAASALARLPDNVRGFYEPQYQLIGSLPYGTFQGLACRCCNHWQEYGHADNCPVRAIQ